MWAMWRSGRALDWESRGTQFESGLLHCHISHQPHVVSFIYQLNVEWPRSVSLKVGQSVFWGKVPPHYTCEVGFCGVVHSVPDSTS